MNNFNETFERLNTLEFYLGGDNNDVPIKKNALVNMRKLLIEIDKNDLIIPEVFPHYGGVGLQFEWEDDWYLEVDCSENNFEFLAVYKSDYKNAVSKDNLSLKDVLALLIEYLQKF